VTHVRRSAPATCFLVSNFYGLLNEQAVAAHEGALRLLSGRDFEDDSQSSARSSTQSSPQSSSVSVISLEAMEASLARAWTTPIDREDLHRISSTLETLLDKTVFVARLCVAMRLERPSEPVTQLTTALVASTEKIKTAIDVLQSNNYAKLLELTRELRALRRDATTHLEAAIHALTVAEVTHGHGVDDVLAMIREKTILEKIDRTLDQCAMLADVLAHVAMKNS
jgi:uncharacterized protein